MAEGTACGAGDISCRKWLKMTNMRQMLLKVKITREIIKRQKQKNWKIL